MATIREWVENELLCYYELGAGLYWFSDKVADFAAHANPADINKTIDAIMDMDDRFIRYYRFDYVKKTDTYKEYDGIVINAPNEGWAWEFLSEINGEFKTPNADDYVCVEVTENPERFD